MDVEIFQLLNECLHFEIPNEVIYLGSHQWQEVEEDNTSIKYCTED